jgi:large subunit ribosomal protein L15
MKLNEIRDNAGARKARTRVGRGIGSSKGKTAGRGVKGQTSRTGVAINGFEGGQMPIYRRLPKRGFTKPFRKEYAEVNLDRLQKAIDAGKLDVAQPINGAALAAAGVITHLRDGVRLLGRGVLTAKVTIEVAGATTAAVAAVEKAGGAVSLTKPKAESGGDNSAA